MLCERDARAAWKRVRRQWLCDCCSGCEQRGELFGVIALTYSNIPPQVPLPLNQLAVFRPACRESGWRYVRRGTCSGRLRFFERRAR